MYAFEQQVGGDQREAICGVTEGRCVVANAEDGCVVAGRNAVRQSVDESELAQRGDFGAGREILLGSGTALITPESWNQITTSFSQYCPEGFRGSRSAADILKDLQEAAG